jgi:hypothetical protein
MFAAYRSTVPRDAIGSYDLQTPNGDGTQPAVNEPLCEPFGSGRGEQKVAFLFFRSDRGESLKLRCGTQHPC